MKLTPKEQKLVLLLACLLVFGFVLRFILPEKETIYISGESEAEKTFHRKGTENAASKGTEEDSQSSEAKKTIEVHIAGAVAHAGVYCLEEGARVYQAVKKAGGALEDADLEKINLAQPLYDGQQIIVPRRLKENTPGEAEAGMPASENSSPREGKVNINTATQSQLEVLPGIGPVKARSIIKYRQENGFFSSIEELLQVNGIGDKTLDGIRELISIY